MSGGEAILEQPHDVDLGAGGGQGVEVEVVDVDVALAIGLGVLRTKKIGFVVRFRAGGADLKHGAHGGVAVDVGVVALEVGQPRVFVRDLVDGLHETCAGLSGASAGGAVDDIRFGSVGEVMGHEFLLDRVLDGFDLRRLCAAAALQRALNGVRDTGGVGHGALAGGFHGQKHGHRDLFLVIGDDASVPLDDHLNHGLLLCSSIYRWDDSRCTTKYSGFDRVCQG